MGLLDKKKTKMTYLTIGQSQPGIFTFKNYEFQKYTLFIKEKNTPFTQLDSILHPW